MDEKRVDYGKKQEEVLRECVKKHFPKTWEFFRPAIEKQMLAQLAGKISDPAKRHEAAVCVAKRAVGLLNASSCVPVNQKAQDINTLFRPMQGCFQADQRLSAAFEKAIVSCIGQKQENQ